MDDAELDEYLRGVMGIITNDELDSYLAWLQGGAVEYGAEPTATDYGKYRTLAFFDRPGAPMRSPEELLQGIVDTIPKLYKTRAVKVAFVDRDTQRRTFRYLRGRTLTDLRAEVDSLMAGTPTHGSDALESNSIDLVTDGFEVLFTRPSAGGALSFVGINKGKGAIHPHFSLIDFGARAKDDECLLYILRALVRANKLQQPTKLNVQLRKLLDIPAGPIAADSAVIDKLGRSFGLYIRVITGMTVPLDNDRVFDDAAHRVMDRNLCTESKPYPIVIASSTNVDAPPCDVYLSNGHYEYINKILQIDVCPITGDIITGDAAVAGRTSEQKADRVISQGRVWHAEPTTVVQSKKQRIDTELVIVYDYETTTDRLGTIEPYALGYMVFDPKKHGECFKDEAASVTRCVRKAGQSKYEVTKPLLDLIWQAPKGTRYTLVSFNGARFDHWLLAQAAARHTMARTFDSPGATGMLTSLFATAGGGLRSLSLLGRHRTLDLAKLAPAMSLADACKGFQCSPTKQEGFSHVVVQQAADEGHLYDWLDSNRQELASYLGRDVLSTSSLFMKLSTALTGHTKQSIYEGDTPCQTIGGHAWAMMQDKCELPSRVKSEELDKTIREAVVGGRVQVYDLEQKHISEDQLHMVDFASLYPTAMASVPKCAELFKDNERWGHYPCTKAGSEPVAVRCWTEGEVGIYDVTVHEQPKGLPNVLPRRDKDQPLGWGCRDEFRCWATHIDIALIVNHGGRVTVHSGYVWPITSQTLFRRFIEPLAEAKDAQDDMAKDDPAFNPALRQVYKLLMNSASGKTCQANYDDEVILASGRAAQESAESKFDKDSEPLVIPLCQETGTVILIGKKPREKVYKKTAKPSILAVLIYAYSRALVWRTLCQHNVLYSDTDSGLFRTADYDALRAAFPKLDPTGRKKALGDLEQELAPHGRAEAFLIAAKDYSVFLYKDAADTVPIPHPKSKIRCKGINMRNDRLIVDDITAKHLATLSFVEQTQAYNEVTRDRSKPLSDVSTMLEYYKKRVTGQKVEVLALQWTRSYKDEANPLALTQRYIVKHL